MTVPWKRYPLGADVVLFQGLVHVAVSRPKNGQWEATATLVPAAQGGVKLLAYGEATCEAAIQQAEKELEGLCREFLAWLERPA